MIDKVPSAPTDNIYKWLTITGISLMIVGSVGPSYLRAQIADQQIKAASAKADQATLEQHKSTLQRLESDANTYVIIHWVGTLFLVGGFAGWFYGAHSDATKLAKLELESKQNQNTTALLEIEKLKLEIEALKREK